jgi:RND family efflux transporter MFP subunit
MVSSEMGGLVTNVLAKEGDWVSAKTTLIAIDAEIMQNNVEELELAWELAKTTYERQKSLWEQEIGSELQFLQIKNQYLSLENKLAAAKAQLQKLNITAPISGTLEEVYVNPGELTRPGSPVFRIVNADEVIVEADIAEKYANILKKNTPVTINFKSLGTSKNAKLDFIGQVINPDNRTFKVNIQLNNSSGILKPNAVASLEIRDFSSTNAMVVPSQIVKKDMRGDYVFVAKNGIAEKTYVSLGLSHSDQSMILDGLNIGDVIIVEGYNEVVSGSKLELKK